MHQADSYICEKCKFSITSSRGGYMYVIDKDKNRVKCSHPEKIYTIRRILGTDATEELIQKSIGFNSYCLCLDCLGEFEIDLDRDIKQCPDCKSSRISDICNLTDKSCPICNKGSIKYIRNITTKHIA